MKAFYPFACRSLISALLLACFAMAPTVEAAQFQVKLKAVGALPPGELIGGWEAKLLLPSQGVGIVTDSGSRQISTASFYASGSTPAQFHLTGTYNQPDPDVTLPYLILTAYNDGVQQGSQPGELATVVLEAAAGKVLTRNDLALIDTVITKAVVGGLVASELVLDFDLVASQPTGKPGDCDNSGTVTIAEVQSAINMFLGLKTVEACVNSDGAGGVSIAEVQKTINSFLGL